MFWTNWYLVLTQVWFCLQILLPSHWPGWTLPVSTMSGIFCIIWHSAQLCEILLTVHRVTSLKWNLSNIKTHNKGNLLPFSTPDFIHHWVSSVGILFVPDNLDALCRHHPSFLSLLTIYNTHFLYWNSLVLSLTTYCHSQTSNEACVSFFCVPFSP